MLNKYCFRAISILQPFKNLSEAKYGHALKGIPRFRGPVNRLEGAL